MSLFLSPQRNAAKRGEEQHDISLTADMQENHMPLMTWEGFVYRKDGVGKTCARSWWRCARNKRRGQRACLGRATVINGKVEVREEHSHGPDSTQSVSLQNLHCNGIAEACCVVHWLPIFRHKIQLKAV